MIAAPVPVDVSTGLGTATRIRSTTKRAANWAVIRAQPTSIAPMNGHTGPLKAPTAPKNSSVVQAVAKRGQTPSVTFQKITRPAAS